MKYSINLILGLSLMTLLFFSSCSPEKGSAKVSQINNLFVFVNAVPAQGEDGIEKLGQPIDLNIIDEIGQKGIGEIIKEGLSDVKLQQRINKTLQVVNQDPQYQGAEGVIFYDNSLNTAVVFKYK